jgi:hypothetical protein
MIQQLLDYAMRMTTPTLVPLTPKTRNAFPFTCIEMNSFPFRVGREGRGYGTSSGEKRGERRRMSSCPNNDCYLEHAGGGRYISREHFQIEQREDGSFYLIDRGSSCGTTVAKAFIGGAGTGGECELKHGDEIILGRIHSPYRFRFTAQGARMAIRTRRPKGHHNGAGNMWLGVAAFTVGILSVAVHGFIL